MYIMEYTHNLKNDQFMNEFIFKNKKNGYFVEIGACTGIRSSQCYAFEKYLEWNGIAVEPQKYFHKELIKNRKNVSFNAISDANSTVEFTEIQNKNMCSGITKKINDLEDKRKFKIQKFRKNEIKYTVESVTLKTLLDKYNSPLTIDWIAIDAEGCELCILSKFFEENNNKYKVMAFSLETNKTDFVKMDEILKKNDYVEVFNPLIKNMRYRGQIVDWEKYYVHCDLKSTIDL